MRGRLFLWITMKKYEKYIEAHPEVKEWLKDRPEATKKMFASRLERFCKDMNISPQEWRHLDKLEARDLAWK